MMLLFERVEDENLFKILKVFHMSIMDECLSSSHQPHPAPSHLGQLTMRIMWKLNLKIQFRASLNSAADL